MKAIAGMDISLVEMKATPHCKLHGAMNKVSPTGAWRCISTYRVIYPPKIWSKKRKKWIQPKDIMDENPCRAGCVVERRGPLGPRSYWELDFDLIDSIMFGEKNENKRP